MAKFSFWGKLENKVLVIVVCTTLATALSVFFITYEFFQYAMLHDIRSRTRIVNNYVQQSLNPDVFTELNLREDNQTELYTRTQQRLNATRILANIRYLFTAKRGQNGKLIYLVDGLPPTAEDFRHIGDPIEKEIIPTIEAALGGKIMESDEILHTQWGAIFATSWPVRDAKEHILGVVVMEFDAQYLDAQSQKIRFYSFFITLLLSALFVFITRMSLVRVSEPYYKTLAYTDILTKMNNRTAFELDLIQLEEESKEKNLPVCLVVYDLNNLKIVNDTQGHLAGDNYLKRMASIIKDSSLNELGQSYRTGGDEFCTIVKGHKLQEVLEKVQEIFQKHCRTTKIEEYFDFSYGVAEFDPQQDRKLHDVLIRADASMYTFKQKRKSNCPYPWSS